MMLIITIKENPNKLNKKVFVWFYSIGLNWSQVFQAELPNILDCWSFLFIWSQVDFYFSLLSTKKKKELFSKFVSVYKILPCSWNLKFHISMVCLFFFFPLLYMLRQCFFMGYKLRLLYSLLCLISMLFSV